MATIVQALPASGKTWLTRNRASWVDGDDLLVTITGQKGKAAFDALYVDPQLHMRMSQAIGDALRRGCNFVSNFDPGWFGFAPTHRFAYRPSAYVEHIKAAGRQDLLDNFDRLTLEKWARDYFDRDRVVWLEPGVFLGDRFPDEVDRGD